MKYQTGCHADGAHGHQHIRETLASLVDGLAAPLQARRIMNPAQRAREMDIEVFSQSLRGPMPDDAWDEYAALDLLNWSCDPGYEFILDAGDLLYVSSEASQDGSPGFDHAAGYPN